MGHPLWWAGLVIFTLVAWYCSHLAMQPAPEGAAWTNTVLWTLAAFSLALGIGLVPALMAVTIYRAPDLAYIDTGTARAALATRPSAWRNALPSDPQAHSFGATPKKKGAGKQLALWARDQTHVAGGRVTLTAMPFLANTYRRHGMVDDGRTAWVLRRMVSQEGSP